MNNFLHHKSYLFVLAHPDDEIYSCAFIQELVQNDKKVQVVYVTSGDYQGAEQGPIREAEALKSMSTLGVLEENVHFLRIPERQLMSKVKVLVETLFEKSENISPDCVVTHDFEGGHNGHDAVSFAASKTAAQHDSDLYVFPAYHDWPEKRLYNQFVSPRQATDTLLLTGKTKSLKSQIVDIHKSQTKFFQIIKDSSSSEAFMSREVLREVKEPIDYTQPPTTPLGYEYPESNIKFEAFKVSIDV